MRKYKHFTEETYTEKRDAARILYNSGVSRTNIHKILNVGVGTVHYLLNYDWEAYREMVKQRSLDTKSKKEQKPVTSTKKEVNVQVYQNKDIEELTKTIAEFTETFRKEAGRLNVALYTLRKAINNEPLKGKSDDKWIFNSPFRKGKNA